MYMQYSEMIRNNSVTPRSILFQMPIKGSEAELLEVIGEVLPHLCTKQPKTVKLLLLAFEMAVGKAGSKNSETVCFK